MPDIGASAGGNSPKKEEKIYDEITPFAFIALWPIYIVLIIVYFFLAARLRPSSLAAAAAVLGFLHGLGFMMFVYFENGPTIERYKFVPGTVLVTMDLACADKPLPDDSELRRLLSVDRYTPAVPIVRGDRAIEYDFDGDSKAELIIPIRCNSRGVCDWLVVATSPTRELGDFYGAQLFVMRSEGPWPDVVGYEPGPQSILTHYQMYHDAAPGNSYRAEGGGDVYDEADLNRLLAEVPNPRCKAGK